jgi:hypothetical protein
MIRISFGIVNSNIGANNYFGIVKTPLDFATIMEKINEGICFIIELLCSLCI